MATLTLDTLSGYTITSVDTLDLFDYADPTKYVCTLDELQSVTVGHSADRDPIQGRSGRQILIRKRNKACTLSGTHALVSQKLLSYQLGSDAENRSDYAVLVTEYHDIKAGATSVKLNKTPVGDGIVSVVLKQGGTFSSLEGAEAAAAGKYAASDGTITLTASDVAVDGVVTVKYFANTDGVVLKNESGKYSKLMTGYLTCTAEDVCGNVCIIEYYFPKLDPSDTFDLEMGDNATTHPFEFASLADVCGGGDGDFYTMTVYGAAA